MLAYCTDSTRMYIYSPGDVPYWVNLPISHNLSISSLTWSPDGKKVLLQGRESLCVANVLGKGTEEIDDEEEWNGLNDITVTMEENVFSK